MRVGNKSCTKKVRMELDAYSRYQVNCLVSRKEGLFGRVRRDKERWSSQYDDVHMFTKRDISRIRFMLGRFGTGSRSK